MNVSDLDDIAPVVGYRATRVIAAHFAGQRLYVPQEADASHPLALLIGMPALRALCAAFGQKRITVPRGSDERRYVLRWRITTLLADGHGAAAVAAAVGLAQRRIEQIRVELARDGWLSFGPGEQPGRGRGRRIGVRPEILGTGEVSDGPPGVSAATPIGLT